MSMTADFEATWTQVKDLLVCPGGDEPLSVCADGQHLCPARGGEPIAVARDGVIDFVSPMSDDRGDMKGFGYQWNKVVADPLPEATVYGKSAAQIRSELLASLGITESQVAGLLGLDVGCGHGLYTNALASLGAQVIGADLSEVVYLCARQYAGKNQDGGSQTFVRADVLSPPFARGKFDVVLSLGMAHHTPDPKSAVLNAARCVKPGGRFMLYIYERGAVGYINLRERFPLPRVLPRPLLHFFCQLLAVPLSLALAIRDKRAPSIRMYNNTALGLFDAYSPKYSYTYEPDEILSWLREAGFSNARRLERCVFVGTRDG